MSRGHREHPGGWGWGELGRFDYREPGRRGSIVGLSSASQRVAGELDFSLKIFMGS